MIVHAGLCAIEPFVAERSTMTNLIESVAACMSTEEQRQALEAFLIDRLACAGQVTGVTAKRRAIWEMMLELSADCSRLISPQSRKQIDALDGPDRFWNPGWKGIDKTRAETGPHRTQLLESLDVVSRARHELGLFNLGSAVLYRMMIDPGRHGFSDTRRPYTPDADRDYPLRTSEGHDVNVAIDANPELNAQVLACVAPYIDPSLSRRARGHLYHANVYGRRLNESDLMRKEEKALTGQFGLFAKQDLAEGLCLGVYGGTLLQRYEIIALTDRRYLASVPLKEGKNQLMDGNNIMSLSNTCFEYDEAGMIVGQDAQLPNLQAKPVWCKTVEGASITVIVFFTRRDIRKGSELRWNYGYNRKALEQHGFIQDRSTKHPGR